MPWQETCDVEERKRFVEDALSGDWSMTELCVFYGVSRKTGYKWLARYEAEGVGGLPDRSRARLTQAHAVSEAIRQRIVAARRRHWSWGPKKLRPWLARHDPGIDWPSLTTMAKILVDAGLVDEHRRRRCRRLKGGQGGLGGGDHANGVWATDFKGEFRLGDGKYCYPLTATDIYSRYLLVCRGQENTRGQTVREAFVRLFREHGIPERIRSDNGSPFASHGAGRLTKLSVFWLDQGIELQRIRPGCPQENGQHERMHLTLKRETTLPPASSMRGQQRRFNAFRRYFNHDRPHEALDQTCPGEHYQSSNRRYEAHPSAAEYPGHYEVRSVRGDGRIKFQGELPYVSEALLRCRVGLLEIADGRWRVYYRHHPLGVISQRGIGIERMRIMALGTTGCEESPE